MDIGEQSTYLRFCSCTPQKRKDFAVVTWLYKGQPRGVPLIWRQFLIWRTCNFRSCAFTRKCFICVTGGGVDVGVSKSKHDFWSITGVISFLNIHQSQSPHYSCILIIILFPDESIYAMDNVQKMMMWGFMSSDVGLTWNVQKPRLDHDKWSLLRSILGAVIHGLSATPVGHFVSLLYCSDKVWPQLSSLIQPFSWLYKYGSYSPENPTKEGAAFPMK